MPNLICCFGCNKTKKMSIFTCPKDVLIKTQWENNLGIILKKNYVICENHFIPDDIEKKIIKKDAQGNIIFSVSIKPILLNLKVKINI